MRVGSKELHWEVQHGDIVTFAQRDGEVRRGRANGLLIFPTHCVLDMGGKHGHPQVVYPGEILRVTDREGKARQTPEVTRSAVTK